MEWLFTEVGENFSDRIRSAAAHGVAGVELWGWRTLDLNAIESALLQSGTSLVSMTVDPSVDITDTENHAAYLDAVEESLAVAQRLGSPLLVTTAGRFIPHLTPSRQRAAVVSALTEAVQILEGASQTLLLEPLNCRVDHKGTYLSSTAEGLAIVEEVSRPQLKLLLDAYHALMMGEDLRSEVANRMSLIGHVQIADMPGRHEPGSGDVDWTGLVCTLLDLGYRGPVGLEYMPTCETRESMAFFETVLRTVEVLQGCSDADYWINRLHEQQ